MRNQNGQINCKIILICICIFFKFTVIIPTSGSASYPLCAFMSNCVKLTPVFHPCSQIITLSTQSVTSSGRDGELQFPTKPTHARASQTQSKGLSAVSSNLLLFQTFSPSLQPAQQISMCFVSFKRSLVMRGSILICSRSSVRNVRRAPTLWAPAWPLTSGTACRLVLSLTA